MHGSRVIDQASNFLHQERQRSLQHRLQFRPVMIHWSFIYSDAPVCLLVKMLYWV